MPLQDNAVENAIRAKADVAAPTSLAAAIDARQKASRPDEGEKRPAPEKDVERRRVPGDDDKEKPKVRQDISMQFATGGTVGVLAVNSSTLDATAKETLGKIGRRLDYVGGKIMETNDRIEALRKALEQTVTAQQKYEAERRELLALNKLYRDLDTELEHIERGGID